MGMNMQEAHALRARIRQGAPYLDALVQYRELESDDAGR